MKRHLDITGQRFGRLTAIKWMGLVPQGKYNRSVWLCRCDCGNEVEIPLNYLRRGGTKSCGCLREEQMAAAREKRNMLGENHPHYKHGESKTKLYKIWATAKHNCSYKHGVNSFYYGGVGIEFYPEWEKAGKHSKPGHWTTDTRKGTASSAKIKQDHTAQTTA